MSPERLTAKNLREAILESVPRTDFTPPTPEGDAHLIVNYAIPFFTPMASNPQEFLEREYGRKLGLTGEELFEQLKTLMLKAWDQMGEDRKYLEEVGGRIIEKLRASQE